MLSILGKSLPNVVGYFATFIMTKMLAGLPMILLRLGPLMRMVFIKACFREKYMTQAEKDEAYFPEVFSQVNSVCCSCVCFILHPSTLFQHHLYSEALVRMGVPKSTFSHRHLLCILLHFSNNSACRSRILPV